MIRRKPISQILKELENNLDYPFIEKLKLAGYNEKEIKSWISKNKKKIKQWKNKKN